MDLPVLYEDADILAVDKPAGILTANLENGAEYAHRLDRDTSGVLVFAKNPTALAFLRAAFTSREVKKVYLAFVYGVPKEKKGVINFAIGRSRKDFRLRSAQPKARGTLRESITRYEALGEDGQGHSLLKVEPETGRTHQIRVHLKAIHHPVVGDPLYAPKHPRDLGFSRLGLHAYSIDLPLPSGGRKEIIASVPGDLKAALLKFGNTAAFAG